MSMIYKLIKSTGYMWMIINSSNNYTNFIKKYGSTVEPPNRGHFATVAFVLSLEVVHFSKVV